MRRPEPALHARGEALFVDDLRGVEGLLQAAVYASPVARGRIIRLDTTAAEAMPGVAGVLTARDIPGDNQVGNIFADEPLLAATEVAYVGETIAVVVATGAALARRAVAAIDAEFAPLPAVFTAREACDQGQFIGPPRTFSLGDVEAAWEDCDVIATGRVDSGAQEHAYLETQSALALPLENGALKVISSTQSPGLTQRMIARALGCPMHQIEVEVLRLGGAFGGKEEQATRWAVLAALAACRFNRPVKLVLQRTEDMRMTGKRHPYSADFKIGLTKAGRILAYEARLYQNAGAVADLSTAVLERTLFHATNSYYIPNVRVTAASGRTSLPPNTACRGFGAPQAMFIMEAAIYQAAMALGVDPAVIQEINLLREGDTFPYGMRVVNSRARRCWETAQGHYAISAQRERVTRFNAAHSRHRKGLALMPICFGISFTTTFLNQASALVHVYTDGSVSVSCGAVEMGQGVKAKIQAVVARTFSLPPERVKLETTSTTRIANMSPTAASTGADLNGEAARLAAVAILERLQKLAARILNSDAQHAITLIEQTVCCDGQPTSLRWDELIQRAYLERCSLSAQAHYARPAIHFDKASEKGQPFAYHVFGVALVEATVDGWRGTYQIDAVSIVHDAGQSLNPLIDRGQIEGGAVQGVGWMTLEEIRHDEHGRLLTDSLTTYKIPDVCFAPDVAVHLLEPADNPPGLFHSKAIGEPPFMYGIGAYFAILTALRAFRPGLDLPFSAPLTPEKVLLALYGNG